MSQPLPYPMLVLTPNASRRALLVAIHAEGWQFAQCPHATALECDDRHVYDANDILYLSSQQDGETGRRFWWAAQMHRWNRMDNHVHLNSWPQMAAYCRRMGERGPRAYEF